MEEKAGSRRGMVVGALAALVLAAVIAVMRQRNAPDLIVQSDEGWAGEIRVAIAGEVLAPGTYTLHGDARLADLIAAAGGYTDTAARDVLNPAARIGDGQAYTIPVQPTAAPRAATATARASGVTAPMRPPEPTHIVSPSPPAMTNVETTVTSDASPAAGVRALTDAAASVAAEVASVAGTPPATDMPGATGTPHPPGAPRDTRAPAAPRPTATSHMIATPRATATLRATGTPHMMPAATTAPMMVNINTASKEELASLPHIGSALAERIVADRAAHGPYKSVSDLARVQGISGRTVEELHDRITVG